MDPEEENETHGALLNDVVLENIFKYLGYKDLKSCRNVGNTTWLKNSKKVWWSQSKVTFTGSDCTTKRITDYLSETEIASNATNYKFFNVHKDDFHIFCEHFGPSIKYLDLSFCDIPFANIFYQFVYTQCPNLEKLVLKNNALFETTGSEELMKWQEPQFRQRTNLKFLKFEDLEVPFPWTEVLSHFPNLQGLEAASDGNVYKAISTIRQNNPQMLKLKHMDIRISIDDDHEESLRPALLDSNLSLETIRINLQDCRSETLVDILNLHAKSLKELCIYGESPRNLQTITLPQPLQKLEILNVGFGFYTAGILKYVPHVRKVVMTNKDDHYLTSLSTSVDPTLRFDSCKELTFHFSEGWGTSDFGNFLNLFPSVEILETSELDNTTFSIVCERLTKLVSFNNILGSQVDVVGLLGFDPDSIVESGFCNPSITDLKDLQSFSMKAGDFMEYITLGSDMSDAEIEMKNGGVILQELERLHHLKSFKLDGYKLTEVETWKEIFAKYSVK